MDDQSLIHRIALSMLKGIGPVNARNLVAYCGGVDVLFTDRHIKRKLATVPGIGDKLIASITDRSVLPQAERELEYARKHDVRIVFYLDDSFPKRLRNCEDAPVLLFVKGSADLDAPRTVSIVGTRQPTEHGKRTCEQLVEALVPTGAAIISGLAYGIDITAHRAALKHKMPTIASVAHGLDKLYPGEHAATARQMLENGGLVSELPSGSPFAPGNFPARNRIIAGLGDCTVVIESGPTGGSLITADIANSYDRDVLAFPGRASDTRSEGCNALIKQNKAALITSADDVIKAMGWEEKKKKAPKQSALFLDLSPEEMQLVDVLKANGKVEIDTLCLHSRMPQGKVAALLLNLEFSGVVRSLPGKVWTLA
ncbi:MAG: DNA-processing protein DprA [Flavobacteriales bacterium]